MSMTELAATAGALVPSGKGILAADESMGTITKRFADIGVEPTAEARRAYRDMLFTTLTWRTSSAGLFYTRRH